MAAALRTLKQFVGIFRKNKVDFPLIESLSPDKLP